MLKGVIFDRDGVLIDTEEINVNSVIKIFGKQNVTLDDKDMITITATNPRDSFPKLIKKYKLNVDVNELIKQHKQMYMRQFNKQVKLNYGVKSILKYLKSNNLKIALTTSSSKQGAYHVLEKFKIKQYFDVIITADDVTKRKPNPMPYNLTIKQLGLKKNELIVIEDSDQGVKAALGAELRVIAINKSYSNHDINKVDYIINKTKEAKPILEKLINKK